MENLTFLESTDKKTVPAKENTTDMKKPEQVDKVEKKPANQKTISQHEHKKINVDSEKLDNLMNLVSDLVTSNAMLSAATKKQDYELLLNIAEKFERLTRQFRENALSVRLVSLKELLLRFKRLVRDLSKELGKSIQFIVEGEDTEMDKNIIDNLSDPLIHLFRNAMDHGIEDPEERMNNNKPAEGVIKLAAASGPFIQVTAPGA